MYTLEVYPALYVQITNKAVHPSFWNVLRILFCEALIPPNKHLIPHNKHIALDVNPTKDCAGSQAPTKGLVLQYPLGPQGLHNKG